MNKKLSLYEILDLSPDSTMEEIETAYRIAKNTYGSNSAALYSMYDNKENTDILRQIEEAYSILSSSEKRKEYDRHEGLLAENLANPSKAFKEGRASEIGQDEAKYRSTSIKSNAKVSSYDAHKKYNLSYTIDPDFEKKIEEAETFNGELLRKIREYKGIDLPRMAELTKVSKSKLINIEMENFSELPARAYTRGYIYQYAKCLKLPTDKVIKTYMERFPREF